MNWTLATLIGSRYAIFSSRTIALSPFLACPPGRATHLSRAEPRDTQSPLCPAKCPSATPFLSDDSTLFHFPYPVSPVFATHTKTAGCVPTIPILELATASFRHRDEKPVIVTPSKSAFTNCDARNAFRMCIYENCRVSCLLLPRISRNTLTSPAIRSVTVLSDRMPGAFLRRSEMSRQIRAWMLLALAGAALVCAQAAAAQQDQDFSKVQIKATKVSGNIYLLEGAGGNIGASVGEDGIVIVDDQFAPLADKIQAALKELKITDKPVRFVINTHYHGDHTGGNVPFSSAGSTLIAQDNVRKRLETGGTAGNGGSIKMDVKPAAKAALPIITFEHDVTVHLNGEDIHALHFPSGHTDGDSIIFFPKNNVVHMGDDFVRYGFPFIDVASGGSVQGMIDAMEKAMAQLPADVKVIPGHGALSNLDDVREFVKMLKETTAVVDKALKQHKTLEQMKKEKILDPWKKWSGDFVSTDAFIETLYNSLTGTKGQFIKHN